MKATQQLPRQLGIHCTYKGYYYLVTALDLALENEDDITLFTKTIFPVIARKYHTNIHCVERDIRTVIDHCWNSSCRENLQAISTYNLKKQPTVGEFIDILYWHIKDFEKTT